MSSTEAAATSLPKSTLDQQRAARAVQCIDKLMNDCDTADQDNYAGEAKRLPVRIMASGLGQAMAFINAKAANRGGLKRLHSDLTAWVIRDQAKRIFASESLNEDSLLHSVIRGDSEFLRWATTETLAFLQWLNRFAEANSLGKREGENS